MAQPSVAESNVLPFACKSPPMEGSFRVHLQQSAKVLQFPSVIRDMTELEKRCLDRLANIFSRATYVRGQEAGEQLGIQEARRRAVGVIQDIRMICGGPIGE